MANENVQGLRGTATKVDLYIAAFAPTVLHSIGWVPGSRVDLQRFSIEMQKYIPAIQQILLQDLQARVLNFDEFQKTGS